MILAIVGPSGVGKTTLIRNLRKMLPMEMLKSVTTREPRPSDLGEFEYLDTELFEQLSITNEFLWIARPYGHAYGTRQSEVNAALVSDHWYGAALVIPAVQKLYEYAQQHRLETRICAICLTLDDAVEMRRRLLERGEEDAEARMKEDSSAAWVEKARESGVPFHFVDTARGPIEITEDVRAIMRDVQEQPISRLIS